MAKKSLEERLDSLEERNKELEHEIERLHAVNEIQNLMSKYEYWLTAGLGTEIAKKFAKKTPGVTAEIWDWGVYDGEGAVSLYGVGHTRAPGDRIGGLTFHTLTTPVIEVARDGKTAKGIWMSPGVETHTIEGKLKPYWSWCKYGIDFVKEDGEWKFWHTHVYAVFRSPYDKSWVEVPDVYGVDFHGMWAKRLGRKPDRPTTRHPIYSTTGKTELVPVPPEPYETWDGKSMV